MTNIRYISLSDLHLGADNSLLTNLGAQTGEVDPHRPSQVLEELVSCIRELLRHNKTMPVLVLNGDFLELALAEDNLALMAFERFLELLFAVDGEQFIDSHLVLNPGNHDHHLWEMARETQYAEFLQGKRTRKPHGDLPPPWHTTRMFNPDLVDSYLLNAVISRHAHMTERGVRIGTVYPNLCLLSGAQRKGVIFSHGHFIESIYTLMTNIGDFVFPKRKSPKEIWDIEKENFAWIDFFWSALGRSGDVGKDIEQIYDMLLVPEARRTLLTQLLRAAGHRWISRWPKLGEWLALLSLPLISKVFNRVGSFEKTQPSVLTSAARDGLKAYLEGPVARQALAELHAPLRAQTTFVFGHTHKPFCDTMKLANFPEPVGVYNSGGWVVDSMNPDSAHGGAIVLVDEEMNVASVRMYNETENRSAAPVKVEAVEGDTDNPLYRHLLDLVKFDQDPWSSFARVAAENVDIYHKRFRDRLKLVRQARAARHRVRRA